MSKRDIQTVCELAAHLALRDALSTPGHSPTPCHIVAPMYASDAMRLQKLGARARRMYAKNADWRSRGVPNYRGWGPAQAREEDKRITEELLKVLNPYGLHATLVDGYSEREDSLCLFILGLPGNTLSGDQEGFGV